MQKLPEAPDKIYAQKKGTVPTKKESRSLSTVTIGVTTPKSFLLVVEGPMYPSLEDALANFSTSNSHPF